MKKRSNQLISGSKSMHRMTCTYLSYPPFEFALDIFRLALERFCYWCIGTSLPPIQPINLVQGNNKPHIAVFQKIKGTQSSASQAHVGISTTTTTMSHKLDPLKRMLLNDWWPGVSITSKPGTLMVTSAFREDLSLIFSTGK